MNRSNAVGARELKTRLGGYLRRVRQGRTLIITERGEPIAEIRPLTREAGPAEATLARLIATGAVTRAHDQSLAPFRQIRSRGRSASDAIIDERQDRF